ncbi:hypothetical protein [Planctomycetes bacterium TBK1r]|uniref:Nucleotide-diphospho-sugar transferase n=1 Tax=Stieleria magnilauensis TaxID=2527963 RepID=A0ABX5XMJ4_9BACT|nr:hypothetical protein TBK1r_18390 [Planctomycetes bacterium TBK1r]
MITFATFHVDLSDRRARRVLPYGAAFRDQYLQMIDLMFRSASLFHPNCRKVVLTDEATLFPQNWGDIEIHRFDIEPKTPMFSRVVSQERYVQQYDFGGPLILLDCDMLFNRSFAGLFPNSDFDIGLTYVERNDQPLNGGLIILADRHPEICSQFFQRFREITESDFSDKHAWFCDQLALAKMIDLDSTVSVGEQSNGRRRATVDEARIELWPCATHNFTPENTFSTILDADQGSWLLHFKGAQKRLMPHYWRAHLEGQSGGGFLSPLRRSISKAAIFMGAVYESIKWRLPKRTESPAA